jgi:hypothetical protein
MNRCTLTLSRRLCGLALALVSAWAGAQTVEPVRPFPANALRGTLVVTSPPEITINGKPERLSPGARIWGANRMLVMSASVVGQPLRVNFVRESLGLVHEVWVLTDAEAALPTPKAP